MESEEKIERVFHRFGLTFAVAGAVLFVLGFLLFASLRSWVSISPYRVYSIMEVAMVGLLVGGVAWQFWGAWRDGVFMEKRYGWRFLPHGLMPLAIIGALIVSDQMKIDLKGVDLILVGLGLMVSGAWTMQVRLPPPPAQSSESSPPA